MAKFKKGYEPWNKGMKGIHLSPSSEFKKGRKPNKLSPMIDKECAFCGKSFSVKAYLERVQCCSIGCANSLKFRGPKHHNWKGDKVSYRSLHRWVEKRLGKPNECTDCGEIVVGKSIHWANISQEYKRDLQDWVRLCAKCHKAFDREEAIA